MLVIFPRIYYVLRFNKARPIYAIFSERKRVKTSKIRILTRKFTLTPISAVFENFKINHRSLRYAC
jgi:hypothetical protein